MTTGLPDTGAARWSYQPVQMLGEDELECWCRLIESRSGIVLGGISRSILESRISARMRALGFGDYQVYRTYLEHEGGAAAVEWQRLLDDLTVQETRFFRHPPSFDLLQDYLRQRVVRRRQQADKRGLGLWSLGCSSGEEAWSMAMTVASVTAEQGGSQYSVLATDISSTALTRARTARYGTGRIAAVPAAWQARYLEPCPDAVKQYQIVPELKARVCFARLNVMDLALAPFTGMDVIFCQNMLIYFRRWQRRDLLNQLAARLLPGGLLILGPGEITDWQHETMLPVADDRVLAFVRKE